MHDDKRQIRKLKKEVKRAGTKKRRRFLKNLSADSDDFEYGGDSSEPLNEKRQNRDEQDSP